MRLVTWFLKAITAPNLLAFGCVLSLAACSGGNSGGNSGDGGDADSPQTPVVEVATGPQPAQNPVGEVIAPENQRVIPTSQARAYRPDSQYASVLKECALADQENICTLEKLPYIGMTDAPLSIEKIMQRVVVTHDWMGRRFEQMLQQMPADLLQLFLPVTTVIIGSEVRPSSFNSYRAVMRLDPRYLWLSVAEKQTVSVSEDFRSNYGADLRFVALRRLMIGDNYATSFWSLTDDRERTLNDIEIALARLLYHELGHANDFVQVNKLAGLSRQLTPVQVLDELADSRVSRLLYEDESLTRQASYLYGLASVRYANATPTEFQKSLLADFVGADMQRGGKMTFYSYSTIREDVADLLSYAMMKFHYDIDIHVGFVNKPESYPDSNCNDYIVDWGIRNRLASPLVLPRARFVVDQIMQSSAELDNFFAGDFGQDVPLRTGEGWCNTRFLNPSQARRTIDQPQWHLQLDQYVGH